MSEHIKESGVGRACQREERKMSASAEQPAACQYLSDPTSVKLHSNQPSMYLPLSPTPERYTKASRIDYACKFDCVFFMHALLRAPLNFSLDFVHVVLII